MLTLDGVLIEQGAFQLRADWALESGRVLALIGPSGAGKSTLLSVIGGFFPAVSGNIRWEGTDMTTTPPGERPIATLFQDNNLFPHMTVGQNVGLGIRPKLRLTKAEVERVNDVLARVGLAGFADRKPAQLSGGQMSRAALARVLLQQKPLVLLDEPFAALGPSMRAEMLDLVAEVLTDKTLIMVTHDPADARRIADDVSVVAEGEATTPAPAQIVLDDPPPSLAAYLG